MRGVYFVIARFCARKAREIVAIHKVAQDKSVIKRIEL